MLQRGIAAAEAALAYGPDDEYAVMSLEPPPEPLVPADVWSEATHSLDGARRGEVARAMIARAESAEFTAVGDIGVASTVSVYAESSGTFRYARSSSAVCSMTVRHAATSASGWAGVDDFDWNRIAFADIAARAVAKCRDAANPRALEPGRYVTVLEPQAVCDLFEPLVRYFLPRIMAEQGKGPFAGEKGSSKLGAPVFDRRFTLRADPTDALMPFVPFDDQGQVFRPTVWVDRGILTQLAYPRDYAVQNLGTEQSLGNSEAFRIDGGTTTVDEMIRTTTRGLLVTRLFGVTPLDDRTVMCTGYTRDGVWLIEHGRVTTAVKNFRFTESPLFAFNNIIDMGPACRVFRPGHPTVVPTIKVRDFNFTSLADAV
jgi:predicted Zn-dependent protease